MKYSMRSIWKARELILQGYTAKEVADIVQIPVAVIRNYTKSERARVKAATAKV